MAAIVDLLRSKQARLNGLDVALTALMGEIRSGDAVQKEGLKVRREALQEELPEHEIVSAALRDQHVPEETAEEVQESRLERCHENKRPVHYQPTLDRLQPSLTTIERPKGGTAIFLIPDQTNMRGEWLLQRVTEWTAKQQHASYTH